jgi:sec-independent protein translocase protein TatA
MSVGPWQLLICILLVIFLFGGKKIPELARSLGKAKGEFKKGLAEGNKVAEQEDDEVPAEEPKKIEKTA